MLWAALWCGLTWASIEVTEPPRLGESTTVVVRDDQGNGIGGETVRAQHRPGLGGEVEVAIGITDGLGRVRWTPRLGGVVTIQTKHHQTRLTVAQAPPLDTVVLLALLVLLAVATGYVGVAPRRYR